MDYRFSILLTVVILAAGCRMSPDPVASTQPFERTAPNTGIVYIIDDSVASGDVGDIRNQMIGEVQSLPAQERFNVLMASDRHVIAAFPGLVPATQENQRQALEFLADNQTQGYADLRKALRAAVDLRPSQAWLISGGQLRGTEEFLEIAADAGKRGIAVNTILSYASWRGDQFRKFYVDLAARSGGKLRTAGK